MKFFERIPITEPDRILRFLRWGLIWGVLLLAIALYLIITFDAKANTPSIFKEAPRLNSVVNFEVESCRVYKSLPGWVRQYMLRERIVAELISEEASLELIWCVKERYRLEKLDAKIIQHCKIGAELKSAARQEITAYVDACRDYEKMRY